MNNSGNYFFILKINYFWKCKKMLNNYYIKRIEQLTNENEQLKEQLKENKENELIKIETNKITFNKLFIENNFISLCNCANFDYNFVLEILTQLKDMKQNETITIMKDYYLFSFMKDIFKNYVYFR